MKRPYKVFSSVLQVTFNVMNIRLSYIDMKMFLAILNSIPQQALKAQQHEKPSGKTYPGTFCT